MWMWRRTPELVVLLVVVVAAVVVGAVLVAGLLADRRAAQTTVGPAPSTAEQVRQDCDTQEDQ